MQVNEMETKDTERGEKREKERERERELAVVGEWTR